MAVLNLGGFVGIQWTPGVLVMVLLVILWGYVVIWNYWRSRNWARLFVMFVSILTILNFLMATVLFAIGRLYRSSVPYDSVIVANAALGAFLLYWLNKRDVRAWFLKSEPSTRVLL
jgi:hypothetical protein